MGFKCSAPGCRTGYSSKTNTENNEGNNISLFKFLDKEKSPDRRKTWVARVPRIDWSPTDNSRLCEKHFLPSDVKTERDDKTRGRTSKRGDLTRKVLKAGVIPKIWPNLPSHLTKDVAPRPTNASSTCRETLVLVREDEKRQADSFKSLTELAEKFTFNNMDCMVIKTETDFTFYNIAVTDKPEIRYVLKLFYDLHYEMWCKGIKVKPKYIFEGKDSCPTKITSFTLLSETLNLLVGSC